MAEQTQPARTVKSTSILEHGRRRILKPNTVQSVRLFKNINNCSFCTVPKNEGKLKELPIVEGNNQTKINERANTPPKGAYTMKVKIYSVNTTDGKRYGLKNANSGDVLYGATSKWKTEKGARAYASKNGYEVIS